MVKPFVACAVITNARQEYLLIRRARKPYVGQWSFISGWGASEKGLSPEEAVVAEVMHDLGTTFSGRFCFSYRQYEFDYADEVHVFLGTVEEGNIQLNPKAALELQWFDANALRHMDNLAFDDKWIFEKIDSQEINRQ